MIVYPNAKVGLQFPRCTAIGWYSLLLNFLKQFFKQFLKSKKETWEIKVIVHLIELSLSNLLLSQVLYIF